jgi:hypothetical protein
MHACHMMRRIHACHMKRRRIHACGWYCHVRLRGPNDVACELRKRIHVRYTSYEEEDTCYNDVAFELRRRIHVRYTSYEEEDTCYNDVACELLSRKR